MSRPGAREGVPRQLAPGEDHHAVLVAGVPGLAVDLAPVGVPGIGGDREFQPVPDLPDQAVPVDNVVGDRDDVVP